MEEIIVTYIKQSNEEIDIAIPNDVKAVQIIEAILHHEKIDEALSGIYEIRVAKDKEEWRSIRNNETLRDNDVWDGQYVILYKKGAIIPSFEMLSAEEVYNEPIKSNVSSNEEDYVWKIIE
ncbi:EsaB/YukD family protein [Bacillus paramycoides]|uniref:EsaB/YukD family protein n=1 Tax=Bacillus paramycoides TaxID=2026194 RepID=UPI00382764A1